MASCDVGKHVWNDSFSDGDTCECGRWYLFEDGHIEKTPDDSLDDIASDLFSELCEGDGEHSEELDKALILKHLSRVSR